VFTILFFLSSGLFLGWSLGANDAANVFGTAVGTKMVKFKTAAWVCSIFLVLGAVISGAGASHTLGKLGSVNAIAGSFAAALAAALAVFWMTRLKLPVSTSQAIVGAIIGWNIFSHSVTDLHSLTKIVSTWIICPLLTAIFAMIMFLLVKRMYNNTKIHLIRIDLYTRFALLLVGAFGSYSLGANNIANVMGVFVPVSPFKDLYLGKYILLTGTQQLFLLGAIMISVGVFTYSKRVMETVGEGIFNLSPITAFVVVASSSLVLYLFASEGLESWLMAHDLPTIPLVPVSSSQAVVGAILGIGVVKGGRNIHFGILGRISVGWISTPLVAGIVVYFLLFFIQNVFSQNVFKEVTFEVSDQVMEKLKAENLPSSKLKAIKGITFPNAVRFKSALNLLGVSDSELENKYFYYAQKADIFVDPKIISGERFGMNWLNKDQIEAIRSLAGIRYTFKWQLQTALMAESSGWRYLPPIKENKCFNKKLERKYQYLSKILSDNTE